LDLTASQSDKNRRVSTELVQEGKTIFKDLKRISDKQMTLDLPAHHPVYQTNFNSKHLIKTLHQVAERQPEDFETLLGQPGVGPQTIRAITLVSELIYGAKPSYADPVRYSFAHGGKDGYPFPVQRKTYDQSIEVLKKAVQQAKIDRSEKLAALKRLVKL
jgi:hypothetical protein